MMGWRKLLPLRLAPGIALTIVLALLAVQVATALLLYALSPSEIQVFGGRWLAERVAESAREVLLKPASQRAQALASVSVDQSVTIELRDEFQTAEVEAPERGRSAWLAGLIRRGLADAAVPEASWKVDVTIHPPHRPWFAAPRPQFVSPAGAGRRWDVGIPARFTIAVRAPDGGWLVFAAAEPWATVRHIIFIAGWLALTALVIGGLSWLAARRVMRPLEAMAGAADRMATMRDPANLPEQGPPELQAIARRINDMQANLKRFVDDRTQMIAAISHDLRTPLTRLRLRAEFVEEQAERQKLLEDIAQMEAIVSQTVEFARQDAITETAVRLDLASLLVSLCDDQADVGHAAYYTGPDHCPIRGQPVALQRAFANLIENAIAYGNEAHVTLEERAGAIVVAIADRGPGIPEAQLEAVFRPFYRLEGSRNRATGGTGLGLSIARSILRAHGGDIVLSNSGHGLIATATLPHAGGALLPEATKPAS